VSNPFPSNDDDQHRSDALVNGLYLLTRDPVLGRTIQNILECEEMSAGRHNGIPAIGVGAGIPRAIGRTLNAVVMAYRSTRELPIGGPVSSSAADAFRAMAHDQVLRVYAAALWRLTPNAPTQILNLNPEGAVRSWIDPTTGRSTVGWVTWEEAIAVQGHAAAWHLWGWQEARELAVRGAKNLVRNGFFRGSNGVWTLAYAIKWLNGERLTDEQYGSRDFAQFGSVASAWVLQALEILVDLEPASPEAETARQILTQFGPVRDWDQAGWRAVIR
jgi:hypothetical protein